MRPPCAAASTRPPCSSPITPLSVTLLPSTLAVTPVGSRCKPLEASLVGSSLARLLPLGLVVSDFGGACLLFIFFALELCIVFFLGWACLLVSFAHNASLCWAGCCDWIGPSFDVLLSDRALPLVWIGPCLLRSVRALPLYAAHLFFLSLVRSLMLLSHCSLILFIPYSLSHNGLKKNFHPTYSVINHTVTHTESASALRVTRTASEFSVTHTEPLSHSHR